MILQFLKCELIFRGALKLDHLLLCRLLTYGHVGSWCM